MSGKKREQEEMDLPVEGEEEERPQDEDPADPPVELAEDLSRHASSEEDAVPVRAGSGSGTHAGSGGEPGVEEGADDPLQAGLHRARALVGEGRVREAIELYRSLTKAFPESVKAKNNLGVLFDETGAHEMALEQFQGARDLDPENVDVLSNLGACLGAVNRFEAAERELRKALRLQPERVDVRANLGVLFYRRGLYAEAEHELRWVCSRDSSHGPAHLYRGEALNRLGRVDDALEMLKRASHLQPENPRPYYVMGILYDRKHLPQEAGEMYRKARELSTR